MTGHRKQTGSDERGLAACDDGSSTLEFALSATLIIALLLATVELCGAFYAYVVMAHAADEGLRYAIVHSADGANLPANVTARVLDQAGISLHNISGLTVVVGAPDGSFTPPNRVSVSLRYPLVPLVGHIFPNPPTMTAFAEGRMVY